MENKNRGVVDSVLGFLRMAGLGLAGRPIIQQCNIKSAKTVTGLFPATVFV
jgi:hypothetical protein